MPNVEGTTNPQFAGRTPLVLSGNRSTFCADANP
jgi:hypothetical protein